MTRARQNAHRSIPSRHAARAAMGPGAQLPGPSGRTVNLVMGARLGSPDAAPRLAGAVARRGRGRRG